MSIALKSPFQIDGGRVKTTSDQATQIQQKIVNVLVTSTLERVGFPEYGGNLFAAVFESTESLEFDDFKVDVIQEVAAGVTGVNIIDITWDAYASSTYNVTVYYKLPLSTPQQFSFRLAVPGELDAETPFNG